MMSTGRQGFTLVEMAVVLVIVGLLLAAMMGPLSAQLEARRISETKAAMELARDALIGFAVIHNRLPCAADPSLAETAANAGEEDPARDGFGRCTRLSGVLPWSTLGLPQTDAWGQRFSYRVSATMTSSLAAKPCGTDTSKPCFLLTDAGDMKIRASAGGTIVANNVPLVLISHGRRATGAYGRDGSQLTGAAGDELENANGDPSFINRFADDDYDDLTNWVPLPILMGRMAAIGRLP